MTVEMPQWIMILGNFGFPIAITVYLFIRFEKKLESLEEVILHLGEIIKNTRKD
ncbi:YvrJ family protein [Ureibacillus sp. FSL K6-3587]|uniref:YvrJ family protein n=1 Tax=Ureibacillus sp. FSL K6-3587 TaxID=2954681 RepID=UPI00315873F9